MFDLDYTIAAMKFIRIVPLALGGLSLAFASLGNLLHTLPHGDVLRCICGLISTVILVVFVIKVILDFPKVREELKTPVPLSVLPTSTMALMLLCVYVRPFLGMFAFVVWSIAVIVHILIIMLFFKRFILGFRLDTVFPTWFIIAVGIGAVCVTAPAMNAIFIGQAAFYFGFTLYFAALTTIIIRMKRIKVFPEHLRPTIAIFTAPMSLLFVGYFNSFVQQGQLNEKLVFFMMAIVSVSYVYVTIKMFSLLRLQFYPTYTTFTFPYVISATGFRLGDGFLAERGLHFLAPVAQISMWIAIAVVVYVAVRYAIFFRISLKS